MLARKKWKHSNPDTSPTFPIPYAESLLAVSHSCQTVPIFVSSTFNDMHAEWGYFEKRVFPELWEWFEKRKLRLVDIILAGALMRHTKHIKIPQKSAYILNQGFLNRYIWIVLSDVFKNRPMSGNYKIGNFLNFALALLCCLFRKKICVIGPDLVLHEIG